MSSLYKFVSLAMMMFCYLSPESPEVILPDPDPVVRALPGFELSCSAMGSPPIYIALIRNSTVLVNETETANIRMYQEGNYSCAASSSYGTDIKKFQVVFTGKIGNFRISFGIRN